MASNLTKLSKTGKRFKAKDGEPLEFIMTKALRHEDRVACLIWPYSKKQDGYGHTKIGAKFRVVSQVVCEMVHGQPSDPSLQAAHSCGNSSCCNPWHLSWKTRKENEADKVKHGTNRRPGIRPRFGEENGFSKLVREQVIAIRASVEPYRDIAERNGISPATVKSIKARRNWSWL